MSGLAGENRLSSRADSSSPHATASKKGAARLVNFFVSSEAREKNTKARALA
ncbi:hypothetical protein MXAN_7130 [Myxococcus xanthus DK 1622]|uniref:Uncharacterized protein n=1 Tax=Myxococcus xanthus (strain DK1622) TaxID=246197 RepID=Q1CWI0_MYXXD|nr:hypothetical protein MXAN_7130 [Myxococcus xanthus DK 1622]